MKAADYRIPWGRPSEHLLAVKREIIGQQMHAQRVHDARNRSSIDTDPPDCAHMPHLITRPKKKKMQEDRQREIAAENHSLMNRLAGIMKEERGDPVKKFAHLSVKYRESLRRKKLLKLETENRRLARSIKKQKPFYSTWEMEKQEEERQILLKTMSRTQRRKERVALFSAAARGGPFSAGRGTGGDGVRGTTKHSGGRSSFSSSSLDDTAATASLVEDGILFRPGPTAVRLRTAKQMQLEVARRRRGHQEQEQGYFASSFSSSNNRPGSGGESGGNNNNNAACHGDGAGGGGWGGTLGGGISSSSTTNDSITVRRRGYSHDNSAANGGKGVILEVNRTGGRRRVSDGGSRRAGTTGEGRPNMIFTPSLVPVGVESVRSRPMSLGDAGREGSVRWAEEKGEHDGENSRGVEQERGGGGAAGSEEGSGDGIAREARTV